MLTVTLDPGHTQGVNPGCLAGYDEGTAMFRLARQLQNCLQGYAGVQVFVTRQTVEDAPALEARGLAAVQNGSTLFLALHSDANRDAGLRGVTVIRSLQRPQSVGLATALAAAVDGVLGCGKSPYPGAQDGVWTRLHPEIAGADYYRVLRAAATGAAVRYIFLLEHSFHSNLIDCAALADPHTLQRLAQAEAAVLAAHFGLAPV